MKVRRDYKKVKDGDLVTPKMKGYKIGCCDCGLVHRIDFEVTPKGRVKFRAYRDVKATEKLRKRMTNENS